MVRTHGIYFIMVTMAFAQMVFYLFFDNKALGGSDGLYINFKPDAELFDLENKRVFYYFTLAMLLLVYVFLRRLLWSPFGRVLAGIRVNEHRMRAMGYGTFGYKLAAFTLAGALAGLAGYLWAAQTGYVNPELMGFHMSAHAIMMVILGGMGNFAGAIVGAFAFEYLLHVFKDLPTIGGFNLGKHWQLWMGLFIVLVVAFAPRGLLGLVERVSARARRSADELKLAALRAAAHQALRRPGGRQRRVAGSLARPHPCRDRPQRRRQVHPDQPALGRPGAHLGQRHARRAGRHRLDARKDLARGPGPQLPEDQHLPALHRVGERAPGRAVARRRTPRAGSSSRRQLRGHQRARRTRAGTGRPAARAATPSPAPSATASSASSRSR